MYVRTPVPTTSRTRGVLWGFYPATRIGAETTFIIHI